MTWNGSNRIPVEKGQRFGGWVIIDPTPIRKGQGRTTHIYYLCQCECGIKKPVLINTMRRGYSVCCGCSKKRRRKHQSHVWKGVGELPGGYFKQVRVGAEKRGIPLLISIEQMWEKFQSQNGTCALSGVPLKMGCRDEEFSASLDRIDSKQPYTFENVQWVHKNVNRMKSNFQDNYFIEMCGSVYLKHRGTNE